MNFFKSGFFTRKGATSQIVACPRPPQANDLVATVKTRRKEKIIKR
jgi:hypothetical protein